MSKVECPDCGRTVSSDAKSCPHCGCPGSRIKSKSSCQTIIGLIVVVILIGLGIKSNDKSKPDAPEEQTIETIQSDANNTPTMESMSDDEYLNPTYDKDEEVISDDEISEPSEIEREEINESIDNGEIDNSIDIIE